MISRYKLNMAGPYHLQEKIPCQDAYYICDTEEGCVVAAVADGLGSEKHSDIGAKVASNVAVRYCAGNYRKDMPDEAVIAMMKRAYTKAYVQVEKVAARAGNDADEYDSTLCMVIYDGKTLYYGQAGDSGLVVAGQDGSYHKITEQQRDENGNVYPLCFGAEYWEFGKVEGNVVSAMLMTDGVWNQVCPPILKNEKQQINVGLVEMFMNHYGLNKTEVKRLERAACQYMSRFSSERLDDDKTVVVLINADAKPLRCSEEYYKSPDWKAIGEEQEMKMYSLKRNVPETDSGEEDAAAAYLPIDLTKVNRAVRRLIKKAAARGTALRRADAEKEG